MTDMTAIDILVNPDDAAIAHAKQVNERMRRSDPSGFSLDATALEQATQAKEEAIVFEKTSTGLGGDHESVRDWKTLAVLERCLLGGLAAHRSQHFRADFGQTQTRRQGRWGW